MVKTERARPNAQYSYRGPGPRAHLLQQLSLHQACFKHGDHDFELPIVYKCATWERRVACIWPFAWVVMDVWWIVLRVNSFRGSEHP